MKIDEVWYASDNILVSVWPTVDTDKSTRRNANIFLDEVYDAEKWCQDTGCGVRTSTWGFSFKNKEQFIMFRLKWIK